MIEINMAGYGEGQSTSSRDALSADCDPIYRRVLRFVCGMNPAYSAMFILVTTITSDRDIGKHDFCSVPLHPVLSSPIAT